MRLDIKLQVKNSCQQKQVSEDSWQQFHQPTDRSGFYTYIKDGNEYWTPTNEPCKTKPEEWKSTHGMGYTRFEAKEMDIAECMLKRPENAYKYYHQLLPMVAQNTAGEWRYKAEPYVYSSNIFGPESDKFGLANVSWLSGTAAWMYIAATQYILGVKAKWDGLLIEPCMPKEWTNVKITRKFRGCTYNITIKNPDSSIFIPHVEGRKEYTVEL